MKTRKSYVWDSARGIYYDESQYRQNASTPVYEDAIFPPNQGIWKSLRWLKVLDLWSLYTVRKLLFEMLRSHIKHFVCIIFSIAVFTGVLMLQRPVVQQNEVQADSTENETLIPVNKTANTSPTYQAQDYTQNDTLQEEITVNVYNGSENNQSNSNKNIALLLKDTEVQPFKENGCSLTEASVRRIVQDELVKYDDLKRRNERPTSVTPENILRKIVNEELVKYSTDRMNSIASIMANLEKSVRKMINDELTRYDADKLGIPDYALETVGGRIVSASDTEGYGTGEYIQIFGINLWRVVNGGPRNIIQPSVHPGNCWSFRGSHANVVIQLAKPVDVTAVTMEHIPASISPSGNISSAPKDFAVIGLTETDAKHHIHLGAFTYVKEGPSRQYFTTAPEKSGTTHVFKAVELWILSNHGNPEFTCVYRFRVHGQLS